MSAGSDFDPTAVPGAHLVASEWVTAAKALKANVPTAADLATMITGIGGDFTMQGAPELEIDLLDENFVLLDSGFLDPADKGTLDRIDIQYGVRESDGQAYHWRIFQVSPQADYTIKTYWIPRVVGELMSIHGPFKVSRASRTRAEFLKMCAAKVPYARFHSKQLDAVQPIASVQIPVSTTTTRQAVSSGGKKLGISTSAMNDNNLTVKGAPMGERQRANANVLLRVADQLGAGDVATVAIIFAGIWESNLEVYASNGSYWGVLSGNVHTFALTDTVGMAKSFLLGGKGYTSAITLVAQGMNNPAAVASHAEGAIPYDSQGISQQYQAQSGWPGAAQAIAEAQAIVQAGGGATGTGGVSGAPVENVQQYNFSIGTPQDPKEDFWTGMNRTAQEVNWELVVDGDDIYYDSDVTLCRQEIAATVNRTDEAVANWSYDWNRTQLPTNFQMDLECGMFEFQAGQVLQLKGFGPASEGSSIGLPGRWLIGEITRQPADIVSTFTLLQPTQPLKEPAPQLGFNTTTKPGQVTLTGKGVNPFANATNLVPERVDDGKDYAMAVGSQILAPFDSKYLGWYTWGGAAGNQPYIGFEIVGGTYNGWAYYFAEQVTVPTFTVGQIIKAGSVITTYASSGTGIECGLANPKNWKQTLAQANGHGGMAPSPEGTRWEQILKALGAPV